MGGASTFDTSGVVYIGTDPAQPGGHVAWSDLTPFAQGFVEGLFASLKQTGFGPVLPFGAGTDLLVAFSDLSPDALALILRDCEALTQSETFTFANTTEAGSYCWQMRQIGWPAVVGGPVLRGRFPPLRPVLNDSGQIDLKEQS